MSISCNLIYSVYFQEDIAPRPSRKTELWTVVLIYHSYLDVFDFHFSKSSDSIALCVNVETSKCTHLFLRFSSIEYYKYQYNNACLILKRHISNHTYNTHSDMGLLVYYTIETWTKCFCVSIPHAFSRQLSVVTYDKHIV